MREGAAGRASSREAIWVGALAVLPLLPFLSTAVSIDAPVFVAVARQIIADPADPFGFEMVWDPTSPKTAVFNRNPPLLSYYLAAWIRVFGERETVMHAVMLPFPLIAALSLLGIARRLAGDGLAPAALLVVTPAFLVLATTLMLDVPMLACMLFAVYALLRASEQGGARWELTAGLAAASAGLMKYAGMSVAPLLAAGLVLLGPRRLLAAARVVGVPLVIWALWGVYTAKLYGTPHFWGARDILGDKIFDPDEFWNQVASTPIYYGGALCFPIFIWARILLRAAKGIELAVVGVLAGTAVVTFVLPDAEPSRRHPIDVEEAALGALSFGGAFVLWASCLGPRRILASAHDRFLALWLGGLLVFSMFLNWHVNAADALLAAPPVILLMFRSEQLRPGRRTVAGWVAFLLPFSLLLAWADADQANFYRTAARRIVSEIGERPGDRWFVGHWGLQHYLEREGFEAVVPPMYGRFFGSEGDWVAWARNVSQLDVNQNLSPDQVRQVWTWEHRSWLPLRTTNHDAGAGFYSHHVGYVPFAWSGAPVESVGLGRIVALHPRQRR